MAPRKIIKAREAQEKLSPPAEKMTSDPRRFLVYGAGAIGSVFGGILALAGHNVAMVGRPWHMDLIRRDGLKLTGLLGNHTIPPDKFSHLVTEISRIPQRDRNFDYILLSVRATQTRESGGILSKFLDGKNKSGPVIVSLQNGIGNVEILTRIFSKRRVLGARVIFGSIIKPGTAHVSVWADDILLGSAIPAKGADPRAKELAALFSKAGLASRAVSDIHPHIWGKLCYNGSLNALATLLGCTYGDLLRSAETRGILHDVVHEIYAVAQAKNITLSPPTPEGYKRKLFNRLIPATADHIPSMAQALARNQRTEIEALNGAVETLGKKHRVPTPANTFLARMIRTKEHLLGL